MTKRIAFVINQLGGLGSGGSDRVVSVLANELVARGWAIDILALTGDPTIERALAPEVHVYFERPAAATNKFVVMGLRLLRGAGLVRSYVRRHPDAVVVSFIAWVNICTVAGMRTVAHGPVILSERTDPASDPSSRLIRWLRDASYRRANALVLQTPDAQAYFSNRIAVATEVIPNPTVAGLPAWQRPASGVEVVTAARLEAEKNIPLLIDAFAPIVRAYPGARLRIFGKGKLRQQLQEYIEASGLSESVTLEGHSRDLHARIAQASMFVLSSSFEGLPNALLEAMSMGMPVISVDCPIGGPRMLIDHEVNGMLVPLGGTTAMTDCMRRLIDQPELAESLGASAAKVRSLYSTQRVADAWEGLVSAVAGVEVGSSRG